ncbi:MAG: ATP-binding protein [Candidatus Omnitrophota bacterium]
MKFNSIKFKIGNLFTIILGIILILYSAFLQTSLSKYLINDLEEELSAKVDELGNIITDELSASSGEDVPAVIQRIFSFQYPPKSDMAAVKKKKSEGEVLSEEEKWFMRFDRLDLSQDMVAFFNAEGRLIYTSQNIPDDLIKKFTPDVNISSGEDSFGEIKSGHNYYRKIQSVISLPAGHPVFVLIASTETPILELLSYRQRMFMVIIPVVLILTAFLGRFLADRILRPVNSIVLTARQISSSDLSRRIGQENIDEEMKVLVDSFNDMIARLENSFKHIEQFSSQVAHELKTPLAILRGETEVALRTDLGPSDYKDVLKENLEEIEKIIKIIEELLLLAKLDYHVKFLKFERFDGKEFLKTIFDKTKILAEEKNIEITYILPKENIFLKGDSLHLRRLFLNIIHNAIKFTPDGKKITIHAVRTEDSLKVSVADQGPGMAEEYLSLIFTRFFQIPSRDEDAQKGNGLGLNIAQAVAKAHRGSIQVESQLNKGSTFTIVLPLAA